MVAAAYGTQGLNGGSVPGPTLNTLPGPNHDWSVSLKDKVIAS